MQGTKLNILALVTLKMLFAYVALTLSDMILVYHTLAYIRMDSRKLRRQQPVKKI